MVLSNGLVIIFAAIGAVIFLFLMDYYYLTLERQASAERDLLEIPDKTDEPNIAA